MTLAVILVAAAVVGVVAELVGMARHERGQVDTYSELIRLLRRRVPWVGVPLLVAITVLAVWAPLHLWGIIP